MLYAMKKITINNGINLDTHKCKVCNAIYLTRKRTARGYRRFSLRKIRSVTCSKQCSKKYRNKGGEK